MHCQSAIARHVADHSLTSGEGFVLASLWLRVRDPFAEQPRVVVSYATLQAVTGLAVATVRDATRKLARVGALRKAGSARGQGTTYILLRPAASETDVELAPFDATEAADVASAAAQLLREAGALRPEAKPRPAKTKLPGFRPDTIAALLEDVAGIEPRFHTTGKRKGTRKPVTSDSNRR